MKKLFPTVALLFLTACSSQIPLPFQSPALSIKDDTLIYDGMLTGDEK